MTYRGRVRNGVILLDEPAAVPEGAIVDIRVVSRTTEQQQTPDLSKSRPSSVEERLAAIWADVPASEWAKLPADLTDNLDHYIYGTSKK